MRSVHRGLSNVPSGVPGKGVRRACGAARRPCLTPNLA
ncbi:hypothetical protein BURCENBC7_AP5481 [Burkholderia cenocepacia BC7]|nr:uncharacterized protein BCN122_I3026 [Burkholderia cenocepacia]EPZ85811.1 hypothetical protein BURCENK562V_C5668 [Burkholderia cenocepacia K56-2Valvano]ERI26772.1 hypothetical protein BURCENBC7_AP5481 [Burkholderia cenocepacia BC7]